MSAKVIPMFAQAVAERAADRVMPPELVPQTLPDYRMAARSKLDGERTVDSLGTWLAIGITVGTAWLTYGWLQQGSRRAESRRKGST